MKSCATCKYENLKATEEPCWRCSNEHNGEYNKCNIWKQATSTTEEVKLPHLQGILADKYRLAVDKNADYGNSFDKIMDKLISHNIDPLQGLYIRLADKFNRFETLLFSDTQRVKDESIRDTLRDLSNYVDLYMAWEAKRDGKV